MISSAWFVTFGWSPGIRGESIGFVERGVAECYDVLVCEDWRSLTVELTFG